MKKPYPVDWCGAKKSDPQPILYFSGVLGKQADEDTGQRSAEERIYEMAQFTHRCFSFEYYRREPRTRRAFRQALKNGVGIFFDSGAFTLQKDPACDWKQVEAFADKYCEFLDRYAKKVDWYAALDWRRDADITWAAQKLMHKRGFYPVPVFHGNQHIDRLFEYIDSGAPLIAIAKPLRNSTIVPGKAQSLTVVDLNTIRKYYHRIFEQVAVRNSKVKLHGLAQTGKMMFEFPWWSTDSTSWTTGSKSGNVLAIDASRHRISSINISPRRIKGMTAEELEEEFESVNWKSLPKAFRDEILRKAEGWGISEKDLLEDYVCRDAYNMREFQEAISSRRHNHSGAGKWKPLL